MGIAKLEKAHRYLQDIENHDWQCSDVDTAELFYESARSARHLLAELITDGTWGQGTEAESWRQAFEKACDSRDWHASRERKAQAELITAHNEIHVLKQRLAKYE